jgi:tetratricopeptide (TPR) repeat protein
MKKKHDLKQEYQTQTKSASIGFRKRILFSIITISSPFIFLGLVELGLRIADYKSGINSLVVVKHFQGKEYYCINPGVSNNYFASHNVGVPEPYEDIFEVNKSPNTFRIFCMGESTMYGYPYPSNITAPRFLKNCLTSLFPERKIEVINLGIPAISSSVVLDLLKQAVEYKPDLIIVYSGHNEFYGTYGVASTEYIGYNRSILDFYLELRKFRIFSLLRNVIDFVKPIFYGQEQQTRKATFLERMVQDRFILYGSPKYDRAKKLFQQNLSEMTDVAAKNNISICFSTLVSNWKDQYPFISLFNQGIQNDKRKQWEVYFQNGIKLEQEGKYDQAIELFNRAQEIDTMRADLYYHLGKCYMSLRKYDMSRKLFMKARDLDVLRFRASDEFNEIVRSVSTSKNTWMADLEKAYIEASPNGILGNELFTEHLHPNVSGYILMGKTFAKVIAEHNQIKPYIQWNWTLDKQNEDKSTYTDVDIESANIRVKILTSAWPFREDATNFSFDPITQVQKIAYAYCRREYSWEQAHYQMAQYYQQNKQYRSAENEYETVASELYLFYHPRMLVGDMKILQEKFKEAEEEYLHAYNLEPNQFVRMRLGTLYLKKGEVDAAIPYFATALAIDRDASVKFPKDAKIMVYLTLGSAYLMKGERALAVNSFQQVLALDPKNIQALALLRQLKATQ